MFHFDPAVKMSHPMHNPNNLQIISVKKKAVVQQGMVASVAYGSTIEGTPLPVQQFLESKLAATRSGAGHFRSAVLNLGFGNIWKKSGFYIRL